MSRRWPRATIAAMKHLVTNDAARPPYRYAARAGIGIGMATAAAVAAVPLALEGHRDGVRDTLADIPDRPALAMSMLALLAIVVVALLALARTASRTRSASSGAVALGGRSRRQPVDDLLDRIRFRVDTFPRRLGLLKLLGIRDLESATPYQELAWVGVGESRRGAAAASRWDEMRPLIERLGIRSAVDVGANVGWFCFAFDRMGIPAVAVEADERNVRVGLYARKRMPARSTIAFMVMQVQPENVHLLPRADGVLFLSVWHHIVRERGLAVASQVLRGIWDRTDRALFFETGEKEFPASWGLPAMEPDPRTWLADYLAATCSGGEVVHLGLHDAGIGNAARNLFAVVRDGG